jgi:hypothetical protein
MATRVSCSRLQALWDAQPAWETAAQETNIIFSLGLRGFSLGVLLVVGPSGRLSTSRLRQGIALD